MQMADHAEYESLHPYPHAHIVLFIAQPMPWRQGIDPTCTCINPHKKGQLYTGSVNGPRIGKNGFYCTDDTSKERHCRVNAICFATKKFKLSHVDEDGCHQVNALVMNLSYNLHNEKKGSPTHTTAL